MTEKKMENGVSVFARTTELLGEDPLEEIFALNLGDFLTEHLISDELAKKIKKHDANDKSDGLKKQLKELISIYSINNTLSVLGFSSKEDYVIYNSIAKTIVQMLDIEACHIFLAEEYAKGLKSEEQDIVLVGSSVDFDDDIYSFKIGCNADDDKSGQALRTLPPSASPLARSSSPYKARLGRRTCFTSSLRQTQPIKKNRPDGRLFLIGGYDKDRTCDPYDVNVVLSR